jgi:hypothetical protein
MVESTEMDLKEIAYKGVGFRQLHNRDYAPLNQINKQVLTLYNASLINDNKRIILKLRNEGINLVRDTLPCTSFTWKDRLLKVERFPESVIISLS